MLNEAKDVGGFLVDSSDVCMHTSKAFAKRIMGALSAVKLSVVVSSNVNREQGRQKTHPKQNKDEKIDKS